VTFAPTVPGSFSDHFGITTSAGIALTSLSGVATAPGQLSITPLNLSYGTVSVGSSAAASFTVSNTGGTTITISKSKPPALGAFVANTTLAEGSSIPPGTSRTLTVSFTPPSGGSFFDSWAITANDGSGPKAVTFAGTGSGSSPAATVAVAAGGDDGLVEKGDAGYPPSPGTVAVASSTDRVVAVRRSAINFPYQPVSVGLLRFDTSGLPANAVVTGAVLRLNVTQVVDGEGRSLVAEWYPASNWPIDSTAWTLGDGNGALAGTPLSVIRVGQDNDFPLQNLSGVNLTGMTGLRLAISGASTPPVGSNDVTFASYENGSAPAARLIITYQIG
jgi:hypothetical protein